MYSTTATGTRMLCSRTAIGKRCAVCNSWIDWKIPIKLFCYISAYKINNYSSSSVFNIPAEPTYKPEHHERKSTPNFWSSSGTNSNKQNATFTSPKTNPSTLKLKGESLAHFEAWNNIKEVLFMQAKLEHKSSLFQWNLNSYIEIDLWYLVCN